MAAQDRESPRVLQMSDTRAETAKLALPEAEPVPAGHWRLVWVDPETRPEWPEDLGTALVPAEMVPAVAPRTGEAVAVWRDAKGEVRPAVVRSGPKLEATFEVAALLETIRREKYLRPTHNRFRWFPFHYHRLPGAVRLAVFRLISALQKRRARRSSFPRYPVDCTADLLRHLAVQTGICPARSAWPDDKRLAIVLTHDVDTAAGQQFARRMADRVRDRGLKAAWFVVGRSYEIDYGFWGELVSDGHEIGLHGVFHDNRLADLPAPEIALRLDSCRDLVERLSIVGFRSPSFRVSDTLYAQVARRFRYDTSVPDTDLGGPWYPRRGCCTVYPFRRDGVTVLPVSLPPEDKFRLDGLTDDEMLDQWRQKLSVIRRVGGLANLALHAEPHLWPGPALDRLYDRLLDLLREFPDAWLATPRQVADWYQVADDWTC